MTLDLEHVFLTNLHEAIIKPKVDGKIDKNKQMCVWGSGKSIQNRTSHNPAVII